MQVCERDTEQGRALAITLTMKINVGLRKMRDRKKPAKLKCSSRVEAYEKAEVKQLVSWLNGIVLVGDAQHRGVSVHDMWIKVCADTRRLTVTIQVWGNVVASQTRKEHQKRPTAL